MQFCKLKTLLLPSIHLVILKFSSARKLSSSTSSPAQLEGEGKLHCRGLNYEIKGFFCIELYPAGSHSNFFFFKKKMDKLLEAFFDLMNFFSYPGGL